MAIYVGDIWVSWCAARGSISQSYHSYPHNKMVCSDLWNDKVPVEAFRDVILQRQPAILDDLLEKAISLRSSSVEHEAGLNKVKHRHISICKSTCEFIQRPRLTMQNQSEIYVKMLLHPFPNSVIPPTRLSAFVLELITIMVQRPCAETVLPLYRVMKGISGGPLETLPEDTMVNF